jgi:acetolactate synthase-1/2/3 large subunit
LSEACSELNKFLRLAGIPVVSSLPAVGLIPSNDELYYGFIGHTGEYHANLSVYHCDLLIVLGARLDVRQTGTEIKDFAVNKKIIRIDIDKNELEYGRISYGLKINCDVKEFLTKILTRWNSGKMKIAPWIETLNMWRKNFNSIQFYQNMALSSLSIIQNVKKYTNGMKVVVTTGVGIHQHLVARYFDFGYPERIFFTSAGHGTMGYDIPTMIGVLIADKTIDIGIVFVGDGSFR